MGIKYNDSIVLYNKYTDGIMQEEYYIGTRFDNVRIEMTEATNRNKSGLDSADAYVVKIPKANIPKEYINPKEWLKLPLTEKPTKFTLSNDDFIVVVKKDELNIDISMDEGLIKSRDYRNGYFNYVKENALAFQINTVDVFQLIPRFQIGGRWWKQKQLV